MRTASITIAEAVNWATNRIVDNLQSFRRPLYRNCTAAAPLAARASSRVPRMLSTHVTSTVVGCRRSRHPSRLFSITDPPQQTFAHPDCVNEAHQRRTGGGRGRWRGHAGTGRPRGALQRRQRRSRRTREDDKPLMSHYKMSRSVRKGAECPYLDTISRQVRRPSLPPAPAVHSSPAQACI